MRVDITHKARPLFRLGGRCAFFTLLVVLVLSAPLGFVGAQGGASPMPPATFDVVGDVPIRTNPTTLTVNLNETFDLNIIVEAGTRYVKSADLRLAYDRTYLRVTANATPGPQVNLLSGGIWLWNNYNNTSGNTKFAFYLLGKRATGTFRMCTLHLQAIQRTPVGSPARITAWPGSGAPLLCDRYGSRVRSIWINTRITVR